ncbi:MAG: hypothetical protein ABSG74_02190 [Candidatus Bathyarchaeia archaeon]
MTSHTVPLAEIWKGFEITRRKPRSFMKVIVKPQVLSVEIGPVL